MTSFPNLDDLSDEALATYEMFSNPLIYLAAPYAHPGPAVRQRRLDRAGSLENSLSGRRTTDSSITAPFFGLIL